MSLGKSSVRECPLLICKTDHREARRIPDVNLASTHFVYDPFNFQHPISDRRGSIAMKKFRPSRKRLAPLVLSCAAASARVASSATSLHDADGDQSGAALMPLENFDHVKLLGDCSC